MCHHRPANHSALIIIYYMPSKLSFRWDHFGKLWLIKCLLNSTWGSSGMIFSFRCCIFPLASWLYSTMDYFFSTINMNNCHLSLVDKRFESESSRWWAALTVMVISKSSCTLTHKTDKDVDVTIKVSFLSFPLLFIIGALWTITDLQYTQYWRRPSVVRRAHSSLIRYRSQHGLNTDRESGGFSFGPLKYRA